MLFSKHVPFTYLIGWSSHNVRYYGVRFRKGCNPSELWSSYFTSSKVVKQFRELYGEPDVIEVRKTFESVTEARIWEHKVLRRLRVTSSSNWLNLSDGSSIPPEAARKARTGVAPGNKGLPQPEHIKAKKRKPKPMATCPHCGKTGGVSAMHLHHFDRCGMLDEGIATKIANTNRNKKLRPDVVEIDAIRSQMNRDERHEINESLGISRGWYQLSDDKISIILDAHRRYLSSRNVLNLGNRKL